MSRRLLLPALLVAASVAAIAALQAAKGDPYDVLVEIHNAAGLRQDSSVRIAGVTVGTVADLEVTRSDTVRVTARLDPGAGPIGRDAHAAVRSANLFGEKFLEIRAGDLRSPAPSGVHIPIARTSQPVELDELLDTLDDGTRPRLATLLNEAGQALAGRRADFNALVNALPNTLDQTGTLVAEFAHDNDALGRLVERSDRILQEVGGQRAALGDLVETAHGALLGFADRPDDLGATLDEAAPTLAQLRRTLGQIESLAVPLEPAADALRQSAPVLAATLRELPPFAAAAEPTLDAAVDSAPSVVRLAGTATPVLRRLRPTTGALRRFSASLAPVSELLESAGPDILGALEGWARLTQVRDGLGHLFRNSVVISPRLLQTAIPAAARRQRTARPQGKAPHRTAAPQPSAPGAPAPAPALKLPVLDLPPVRLPDLPIAGAEPIEKPVNTLLDFLLRP